MRLSTDDNGWDDVPGISALSHIDNIVGRAAIANEVFDHCESTDPGNHSFAVVPGG